VIEVVINVSKALIKAGARRNASGIRQLIFVMKAIVMQLYEAMMHCRCIWDELPSAVSRNEKFRMSRR
jgi:hypothetical protein